MNLQMRRYFKKSEYNIDKRNKKDNFSFLNKTHCKKHQTVLAGDSITEIFNMELFDSYIKSNDTFVYNRGISGDTSNHFLDRFEENVLYLEPKNLVILIGTNDLTLIDDYTYVAENIDKVLELSRKKCPNVNLILQAVYPVDYKNVKKNLKIKNLNKLLSDIAVKHSAFFLDLTSKFSDSKGGFNPKYTYDGLHPNAKGFEIAAKEIIPFLI